MDLNLDWLSTIYHRKTAAESVLKVVSAEISSATTKGDNYTCDLRKINAVVLLGSGKEEKRSVIVKEMPSSPFKRQSMTRSGVFVREIIMYRDILPAMENIFQESGDHGDRIWPTLLEYRNYDRIVIEDLSNDEFRMGNRKTGLDLPHCELLMKHLAKYHAASAILIQKNLVPPGLFEKHFTVQSPESLIQRFAVGLYNEFTESMASWGPEWESAQQRVRSFIPTASAGLLKAFNFNETCCKVLSHGDAWVNNILFKYGVDPDLPIGVKFVDFQASFVSSPVFDILYFLATSPSLHVRQNHKADLIRTYHEALVLYLGRFNYTGQLPSLESLNEEMKTRGLITLHTGVAFLPSFKADAEDVPDLEAIFKNFAKKDAGQPTQKLPSVNFTRENYVTLMKLIIQDAVDDGVV